MTVTKEKKSKFSLEFCSTATFPCTREGPSKVAVREQVVFLPFDVMPNILSRLPVRSLLRFRCVCKQWLNLTRDPDFIEEQRKRASGRSALISKLSLAHKRSPFGLANEHKITLYCFGDDGEIKDCSFRIKHGKLNHYMFSNSVNGLVCLYYVYGGDGCHYLFNPSIRELVELPRMRSSTDEGKNVGLAFDIFTGEYKIVRLFRKEDYPRRCGCEVLTVGTSEWRSVGDAPCKLVMSQPVFLNGSLHWIAMCYNGADDTDQAVPAILVFDASDEKFRLMPIPNSSHSIHIKHVALVEWGAHLCFVERPCPTAFLRIWMFRDHTCPQWAEEHSIDMSRYLTIYTRAYIIGIRDEKILLQGVLGLKGKGNNHPQGFHDTLQTIYFYDLHSRTVQFYCRASAYLHFTTESLVSPRNLAGNLPFVGGRVMKPIW